MAQGIFFLQGRAYAVSILAFGRVEKHPDGYIAYQLGIRCIVIGEGDTYEEALADVTSAIQCHVDTFGPEVLKVYEH